MITTLRWTGFRGLADGSVKFSQSPGTWRRLTVFTGPNGSGKTSFLEMISIALSAKSFRASRLTPAVKRGGQGFRIKAFIEGATAAASHQRSVSIVGSSGTSVQVDGKHVRSRAEFIVTCPIVSYAPEGESVIDGPSEVGRALLDQELFHVEPSYYTVYRQYQRALLHRNSVLKRISRSRTLSGIDQAELKVWTDILCQQGHELARLRNDSVSRISRRLSELLDDDDELALRYSGIDESTEAADRVSAFDLSEQISSLSNSNANVAARGIPSDIDENLLPLSPDLPEGSESMVHMELSHRMPVDRFLSFSLTESGDYSDKIKVEVDIEAERLAMGSTEFNRVLSVIKNRRDLSGDILITNLEEFNYATVHLMVPSEEGLGLRSFDWNYRDYEWITRSGVEHSCEFQPVGPQPENVSSQGHMPPESHKFENSSGTGRHKILISLKYESKSITLDGLQDELRRVAENEYRLGYSMAGPHRDRLIIRANGAPASTFLSRGQKKKLLLYIKIAQVQCLLKVFREMPVLLVDDPGSEIDDDNLARFLFKLSELPAQIFMSTTDSERIIRLIKEHKLQTDLAMFHVEHGGLFAQQSLPR